MQRNVLPWVLLATAIVVALTVLRSPAPPVAVPAASTAGSVAPTAPGSVPPAPTYNDPPMDETERRQYHVRVGHETCEDGAKRINELEGLTPTDPKGLKYISGCIRHGSLAWYNCVLAAKTRLEAGTCNRRFLHSDAPQ